MNRHDAIYDKIHEMPGAKFVMILMVIMVHSNFIGSELTEDVTSTAAGVINYITGPYGLTRIAVPVFFIVAGFLFFRGVECFTLATYRRKLRSRVTTLLVPYLMWNVAASILFLFKTLWLGFDGLGVVADGHVDWLKFMAGFWTLPYDLALWFIRDLMVYCLLAPVVWIVVKRKWLFACVFLAFSLPFDVRSGILWFMIGAFMSQNQEVWSQVTAPRYAIVFCVGYAVLCYLLSFSALPEIVAFFLFAGYVMCGLAFTMACGRWFSSNKIGRRLTPLLGSTFFIYAFHALYCSVVRNAWLRLIGCSTTSTALAVLLLTFITLTVTSMVTYFILRRFAPRLIRLLTGDRQ